MHLAASCSGGINAGRLGQRRHAGARPHDVELRHAVAVALDEGRGGFVVPAVEEVGAVTAVGPGAEHRWVVEQVLDLE